MIMSLKEMVQNRILDRKNRVKHRDYDSWDDGYICAVETELDFLTELLIKIDDVANLIINFGAKNG